jgi:hypothetical protein
MKTLTSHRSASTVISSAGAIASLRKHREREENGRSVGCALSTTPVNRGRNSVATSEVALGVVAVRIILDLRARLRKRVGGRLCDLGATVKMKTIIIMRMKKKSLIVSEVVATAAAAVMAVARREVVR